MIQMTQEQFDAANFKKVSVLRKGWYQAEVTCPNCGGTGYVTYSHLDNARCWECNCTGKKMEKIQIVKKNPILSPEEVQARINARREKNRKHWLDLGFKKVDFEQADWIWKVCEVYFREDDYYRIVKETEKAYLIEQVCDINESQSYSSNWVPKKAIRFKKEAAK